MTVNQDEARFESATGSQTIELITHDRLKELIRYEPETGLVFRLEQYPTGEPIDLSLPIGTMRPDGYVVCELDGRSYYLHRLAFFYMTGEWPKITDHRNMNRSDNRWENIRAASALQNRGNSVGFPNRRKSAYKGVYRAKRGKANPWCAAIKINGRQKHLGSFSTEEAAHEAYMKAAVEHYGEFANAAIRETSASSTEAL